MTHTSSEMCPPFRSDEQAIRARNGDQRSRERIVEDYLLERRLSDQLRTATVDERPAIYVSAYNEFYETMMTKGDAQDNAPGRRAERNRVRLKALQRFLTPDSDFLEIASGDAAFAFTVAPHVGHVYATDVQDVNVDHAAAPSNFTFVKTEGMYVPLPDGSVDFVFSDQFMEHLHPEDAEVQLCEIVRLLRPSGIYRCNTPSRTTGPHDVTAYFDDVATGFHLKEYDYASIVGAFRKAGFRKVWLFASGGGREIRIPYWAGRLIDGVLLSLPGSLRRRLRHSRPIRGLAGLSVMGIK